MLWMGLTVRPISQALDVEICLNPNHDHRDDQLGCNAAEALGHADPGLTCGHDQHAKEQKIKRKYSGFAKDYFASLAFQYPLFIRKSSIIDDITPVQNVYFLDAPFEPSRGPPCQFGYIIFPPITQIFEIPYPHIAHMGWGEDESFAKPTRALSAFHSHLRFSHPSPDFRDQG